MKRHAESEVKKEVKENEFEELLKEVFGESDFDKVKDRVVATTLGVMAGEIDKAINYLRARDEIEKMMLDKEKHAVEYLKVLIDERKSFEECKDACLVSCAMCDVLADEDPVCNMAEALADEDLVCNMAEVLADYESAVIYYGTIKYSGVHDEKVVDALLGEVQESVYRIVECADAVKARFDLEEAQIVLVRGYDYALSLKTMLEDDEEDLSEEERSKIEEELESTEKEIQKIEKKIEELKKSQQKVPDSDPMGDKGEK